MTLPDIGCAGAGEPGLVSVVIPAYNRAYIIRPTIESVLAQTYANLEVIVVDDGSKDDTEAVVRSYPDPRVRYHRQPNGGVASARNTGFRLARGEFVALLDSDDLWVPWKLAAQVAVLGARPDLGMVWTDMTAIDIEDRVLRERYLRVFYAYDDARVAEMFAQHVSLGSLWPDAPAELRTSVVHTGDIFPYMLLGNHVHTSTVLMRRARLRAAGGFDETFRLAGEDYDFHLRITREGPVALLDAPGILYRIGHADQITEPSRELPIAEGNLRTVEHWLERVSANPPLPPAMLQRRLAESHRWLGEAAVLAGKPRLGAHNLLRGMRLGARDARAMGLLVACLVPPSVFRAARGLVQQVRGTAPHVAA